MKKVFEASGKSIEEAIDAALALAGDVSLADTDVEVLESGARGIFGIGSKPARVRISFDDGQPEEKPAVKKEFKPKEIKPIEFKLEDARPVERKPAKIRPAQPASAKGGKSEKSDKPRGNKEGGREGRERREKKEPFDNISVKQNAFEAAVAAAEEAPKRSRTLPAVKEEADVTEAEKKVAAEALDFLKGICDKMEVAPEAEVVYTTETVNIYLTGKNLGSLIGRRGETLNALQYLVNLVVNRHSEGHVRIVLDVEGYREEREDTLVSFARKMADKCAKTGNKVELEPMNPQERRIVHITLEPDERVDTLSYGSEPFRKVVIIPKNRKSRR